MTPNPSTLAHTLSSYGRGGDTTLVHMSPMEVSGLASLHPRGKLPRNPVTGLPEAFELWPLLAALGIGLTGGMAAPAVMGAMGAGAAGVGAGAAASGAASAGGLGSLLTGAMASPWFLPAAMMGMTGLDLLTQEGPPKDLDGNYDRRERKLKRKWDPRSGMFGGSSYPLYDSYAEGGMVEERGIQPMNRLSGGVGGQEGQAQDPGMEDKMLVKEAMKALMGQSENPEAVMRAFVERFGEEALQDLMSRLRAGGSQGDMTDQRDMMNRGGMMMEGPGDGMSDSMPAMAKGMGGMRPAQLSDGEFVVPADVVAHLGNGSSKAGGQALMQMMDRLRAARTGSAAPPRRIDPGSMLPV